MNAAAPMNDGNTSGSGASTRHSGASGRSVRVNSHASVTPITPAAVVTRAASCTVRHAGRQRFAEHLAAVTAEGQRPPGHVQHRGGEGDGDGTAHEVQRHGGPAGDRRRRDRLLVASGSNAGANRVRLP